jgi:hypothetical protein
MTKESAIHMAEIQSCESGEVSIVVFSHSEYSCLFENDYIEKDGDAVVARFLGGELC